MIAIFFIKKQQTTLGNSLYWGNWKASLWNNNKMRGQARLGFSGISRVRMPVKSF